MRVAVIKFNAVRGLYPMDINDITSGIDNAERKPILSPSDAPYPTGFIVAKAMADGIPTDLVTCNYKDGRPPQQFIAMRP